MQCEGASSSAKIPQAVVVVSLCACVLLGSSQAVARDIALAQVDGEAITADDVAHFVGAPLTRLEEQIYALKRRALDALIARKLVGKEAARRGMSPQTLLEVETRDIGDITEQEIDSTYRQHKEQLTTDETTAKEQIRRQLYAQKFATRERAFIDRLRAQSGVTVNLRSHVVLRVAPSIEGAPFKGPGTAPVTIVEFQDFHCPFCRRVQPTLAQLSARYGDRVRLVYRDFPIDSLHPKARSVHEAARCAHAQGRFWAYHDAVYSSSSTARLDDLKAIAREAGLDIGAFDACMAAGTYRAAVQRDIDDGTPSA